MQPYHLKRMHPGSKASSKCSRFKSKYKRDIFIDPITSKRNKRKRLKESKVTSAESAETIFWSTSSPKRRVDKKATKPVKGLNDHLGPISDPTPIYNYNDGVVQLCQEDIKKHFPYGAVQPHTRDMGSSSYFESATTTRSPRRSFKYEDVLENKLRSYYCHRRGKGDNSPRKSYPVMNLYRPTRVRQSYCILRHAEQGKARKKVKPPNSQNCCTGATRCVGNMKRKMSPKNMTDKDVKKIEARSSIGNEKDQTINVQINQNKDTCSETTRVGMSPCNHTCCNYPSNQKIEHFNLPLKHRYQLKSSEIEVGDQSTDLNCKFNKTCGFTATNCNKKRGRTVKKQTVAKNNDHNEGYFYGDTHFQNVKTNNTFKSQNKHHSRKSIKSINTIGQCSVQRQCSDGYAVEGGQMSSQPFPVLGRLEKNAVCQTANGNFYHSNPKRRPNYMCHHKKLISKNTSLQGDNNLRICKRGFPVQKRHKNIHDIHNEDLAISDNETELASETSKSIQDNRAATRLVNKPYASTSSIRSQKTITSPFKKSEYAQQRYERYEANKIRKSLRQVKHATDLSDAVKTRANERIDSQSKKISFYENPDETYRHISKETNFDSKLLSSNNDLQGKRNNDLQGKRDCTTGPGSKNDEQACRPEVVGQEQNHPDMTNKTFASVRDYGKESVSSLISIVEDDKKPDWLIHELPHAPTLSARGKGFIAENVLQSDIFQDVKKPDEDNTIATLEFSKSIYSKASDNENAGCETDNRVAAFGRIKRRVYKNTFEKASKVSGLPLTPLCSKSPDKKVIISPHKPTHLGHVEADRNALKREFMPVPKPRTKTSSFIKQEKQRQANESFQAKMKSEHSLLREQLTNHSGKTNIQSFREARDVNLTPNNDASHYGEAKGRTDTIYKKSNEIHVESNEETRTASENKMASLSALSKAGERATNMEDITMSLLMGKSLPNIDKDQCQRSIQSGHVMTVRQKSNQAGHTDRSNDDFRQAFSIVDLKSVIESTVKENIELYMQQIKAENESKNILDCTKHDFQSPEERDSNLKKLFLLGFSPPTSSSTNTIAEQRRKKSIFTKRTPSVKSAAEMTKNKPEVSISPSPSCYFSTRPEQSQDQNHALDRGMSLQALSDANKTNCEERKCIDKVSSFLSVSKNISTILETACANLTDSDPGVHEGSHKNMTNPSSMISHMECYAEPSEDVDSVQDVAKRNPDSGFRCVGSCSFYASNVNAYLVPRSGGKGGHNVLLYLSQGDGQPKAKVVVEPPNNRSYHSPRVLSDNGYIHVVFEEPTCTEDKEAQIGNDGMQTPICENSAQTDTLLLADRLVQTDTELDRFSPQLDIYEETDCKLADEGELQCKSRCSSDGDHVSRYRGQEKSAFAGYKSSFRPEELQGIASERLYNNSLLEMCTSLILGEMYQRHHPECCLQPPGNRQNQIPEKPFASHSGDQMSRKSYDKTDMTQAAKQECSTFSIPHALSSETIHPRVEVKKAGCKSTTYLTNKQQSEDSDCPGRIFIQNQRSVGADSDTSSAKNAANTNQDASMPFSESDISQCFYGGENKNKVVPQNSVFQRRIGFGKKFPVKSECDLQNTDTFLESRKSYKSEKFKSKKDSGLTPTKKYNISNKVTRVVKSDESKNKDQTTHILPFDHSFLNDHVQSKNRYFEDYKNIKAGTEEPTRQEFQQNSGPQSWSLKLPSPSPRARGVFYSMTNGPAAERSRAKRSQITFNTLQSDSFDRSECSRPSDKETDTEVNNSSTGRESVISFETDLEDKMNRSRTRRSTSFFSPIASRRQSTSSANYKDHKPANATDDDQRSSTSKASASPCYNQGPALVDGNNYLPWNYFRETAPNESEDLGKANYKYVVKSSDDDIFVRKQMNPVNSHLKKKQSVIEDSCSERPLNQREALKKKNQQLRFATAEQSQAWQTKAGTTGFVKYSSLSSAKNTGSLFHGKNITFTTSPSSSESKDKLAGFASPNLSSKPKLDGEEKNVSKQDVSTDTRKSKPEGEFLPLSQRWVNRFAETPRKELSTGKYKTDLNLLSPKSRPPPTQQQKFIRELQQPQISPPTQRKIRQCHSPNPTNYQQNHFTQRHLGTSASLCPNTFSQKQNALEGSQSQQHQYKNQQRSQFQQLQQQQQLSETPTPTVRQLLRRDPIKTAISPNRIVIKSGHFHPTISDASCRLASEVAGKKPSQRVRFSDQITEFRNNTAEKFFAAPRMTCEANNFIEIPPILFSKQPSKRRQQLCYQPAAYPPCAHVFPVGRVAESESLKGQTKGPLALSRSQQSHAASGTPHKSLRQLAPHQETERLDSGYNTPTTPTRRQDLSSSDSCPTAWDMAIQRKLNKRLKRFE